MGGRQSEADKPPILGKNIRLSSTGGGPSDIRQSSDLASEPICCDHQVTSSQSNTVTVKMLDTPHKQTNKKQPFLRLLISFWFQNNRLEISFSEHIEPFNSYEYEQSYAIFSD